MRNTYAKYMLKGAIICTLALFGALLNPHLANADQTECSITSALFSPNPFHFGNYTNANTAGVPDAQLSVINAGLTGTPISLGEGNLCANIYVFNALGQLQECCSCKSSANSLKTFSVNSNLTSNPRTSSVLHAGFIEIVSSTPSPACDAASSFTPDGDLGAWITHVSKNTSGGFSVSETPFLAAPLLSGGLGYLQGKCGAITNRCTCP